MPDIPRSDPNDVTARALAKLRDFVATLDDDERAVIAALLAAGVAEAYTDEPEVVGFSAEGSEPTVGWRPERLSESLSERIRDQGLRVEFD